MHPTGRQTQNPARRWQLLSYRSAAALTTNQDLSLYLDGLPELVEWSTRRMRRASGISRPEDPPPASSRR